MDQEVRKKLNYSNEYLGSVTMKNIWIFLLTVFCCNSILNPVKAASQETDPKLLFELSLADLMSVRINSGTLTGTSGITAPVARTVITAKEIAVTPARTILDLIEVYVPGATFVESWGATTQLGIRGILGDQNNSFLYLVNGKNTNLKATQGALAELYNRDLNDIEKIEIIRGPGSVTYGAGAISGVINVFTKDAESSPGFKGGVDVNELYRYQNVYMSYGHEGETTDWSLYGSFNNSDGEEHSDWFYIDRAHDWGWGYMSSEWGGEKGTGTDPPKMYGDFDNKPQIKLHFDLKHDEFNFWARYTSYSKRNTFFERELVDGYHAGGRYGETFAVALENDHEFSKVSSLATSFVFDSHSLRNATSLTSAESFDHVAQISDSYSENELNFKTTYHHTVDQHKFAFGGEVSYEFWRPEWNNDSSTFVMNAPTGNLYLTEDAEKYQYSGSGYVVSSLDDTRYSLFGEANLDLYKYVTLLLSARYDKSRYSEKAISPRVAIVSEINSTNVLKAIWQESVRIANFTDLYVEDEYFHNSSEPEKLKSFELIYERIQGNNTHISLSGFYNDIDQLTWNYDVHKTDLVGSYDLLGFEAECKYSKDAFTIGANYAFIEQLDWDAKSEPSWTLTNLEGATMPIEEYGDSRINNLPQNTFKIYSTNTWTDSISSHVNARVFWDFGQMSMLDIYMDSHNEYGDPASQAEMQAIYDAVTDEGYGQPSFTLNASLSWQLPIKTEAVLMLYGQNILSYNNVRYYHQWWGYASRQYPRSVSCIDEPMSIGLKLDISF